MKTLSVLLLFLAISSARADTIIVPVRGDIVYGADGSYITIVRVTNVDTKPVSVRVGEVFPARLDHPCSVTTPIIIQPLDTADVPTGCIGLYAYTLETDGDVRIDAEVITTRPISLPGGGGTSSNYWQQFETARTWLPPARLAIIPRVWMGGATRTNLFVINPNDYPIHFALTTTRRSPSAPTQSTSYIIAPKTMSVISPEAIDDPACRLPLVCGADYRITFSADGPYYATSSSIMPFADAVVGSPSVLPMQP